MPAVSLTGNPTEGSKERVVVTYSDIDNESSTAAPTSTPSLHSSKTSNTSISTTGLTSGASRVLKDPINPRPFLSTLMGKHVCVKLKWNHQEFVGVLNSFDAYFNLQLFEAEEFVKGVPNGQLGTLFIRCNNVLWIRGAPQSMLEKSRVKREADEAKKVNGSAKKGAVKTEDGADDGDQEMAG